MLEHRLKRSPRRTVLQETRPGWVHKLRVLIENPLWPVKKPPELQTPMLKEKPGTVQWRSLTTPISARPARSTSQTQGTWTACAPKPRHALLPVAFLPNTQPSLNLRGKKSQLRDIPQKNCIVLLETEHGGGDGAPAPEAACAKTAGSRDTGTKHHGKAREAAGQELGLSRESGGR